MADSADSVLVEIKDKNVAVSCQLELYSCKEPIHIKE